MQIQATNGFVFVIQDKAKSEESGLVIPGIGREKPHQGTVLSIGDLVLDKKIKGSKNKKCLFHKGSGFKIEYEGVEYLVLSAEHIIAIVNDTNK
jgi:co-chaperonin GroES (HSP10)